MIKKLHRQFVGIAISSLMLIMALIIGAINLVSFQQMRGRMDGVLQLIAEHDGKIPAPDFDRRQPGQRPKFSFDFQLTPETRFETRYFTARLDPSGEILELDLSHIASVGEQEALEYVRQILGKSKDRGQLGDYRYLLAEQPDGALLVVMNGRMQLQALWSFLQISCIIALMSLLLMFLLVSLLARRALRPVQSSLEKQKQFITDAGHEIKTPLAIISSSADVLEITQGQNEWVESIRKQTARLNLLVQKLLTLTKLEEDSAEKSYRLFDFSGLTQETAESFRLMAAQKGQRLVLNLSPGLSYLGDPDEICQILTILLDNAVKYAPENSEINLHLEAAGKKLRLEVRNLLDGPAIDHPERLFDRFFRADSSRSRESGGYGIGLSIAKAAAEAHRGDLTAFYEDEQQAICLRLTLPKSGRES